MPERELIRTQERLRSLLNANRSIVSELSLDAVLRRIVECARDVAGARYAALGVIGTDGRLEQFIHVGVDDSTVAAINQQPQGHGILGALIAKPDPIRVREVVKDNRHVGFPKGHPRLRSFLGVPIQVPGSVFGNLYLAEREGGEFTDEDEELVLGLAATAGIAIENARLYEESRQRQEWLRARAEVSRHVITADQSESLRQIARTVLRLAAADAVTVVRPEPGTTMLRVVAHSGISADRIVGTLYPQQNSLASAAMEHGSGMIFADYQRYAEAAITSSPEPEPCSVMALPLMAEHGVAGAVLVTRVGRTRPFTESDLEMAESFAGQAAVAMELAEARSNQEHLTLLEERDRIARDLHDHVIQRLFAIGLGVQSIATGLATGSTDADGPDPARRLIDIVDDVDETIREIRTAIFALRDNAGSHSGLRAAVLAVIIDVEPTLPRRPDVIFDGPLDTLIDNELIADVEAVIREGLSNVARHADARQSRVRVALAGQELQVIISDDGRGIGASGRRSGLNNLRRRAERRRGSLAIAPGEASGTRLCWTVPVQLSRGGDDHHDHDHDGHDHHGHDHPGDGRRRVDHDEPGGVR